MFSLASCENSSTKKTSKTIKDGVVKQYRAGHILKNEITFKNGKKNGIAKSYYKSGKIHNQVTYLNDIKNGEAIVYYENGNIYQSTQYDSGKMSGIRKKYRENGQLMAEIPYLNDMPCKGLKEYLLDGSIKKKYPKIVIKPIDNILKNGSYILRFEISDKSKKVEYYPGIQLPKNGCFTEKINPMSSQIKGVTQLRFDVPTGMFLMEEIKMTAVVTTILGNPFVTDISYNLALENRGF